MTDDRAAPGPGVSEATDESRRTLVARGLGLVGAGALLGGLAGALVALVGVLATHRRSTRPTTLAVLVLILGAAVATLVEAPLGEATLSSAFARDRPVASALGTAAGILLLVVVVTLLLRTGSSALAAGGTSATAGRRPGAPDAVAPDPSRPVSRTALAATLAVGLVGLVALGLTAPAPPRATEEVAASVAIGAGWGRPVEGRILIDGTEPPLPVVVAAVAPAGPRWWTALAGVTTMGLVGLLVRRRLGDVAALGTAAVTGIALIAVRADLAACLAAALTAATLLLADPRDRTVGRAALAGATFGGVCLCLPAALLLLPLVVVALAVRPLARALTPGHALAGGAGALAVVVPWWRWVHERFATWLPAEDLVLPASTVAAVCLPLLVALGVALIARPTPREDPAGS